MDVYDVCYIVLGVSRCSKVVTPFVLTFSPQDVCFGERHYIILMVTTWGGTIFLIYA